MKALLAKGMLKGYEVGYAATFPETEAGTAHVITMIGRNFDPPVR